MDKITPPLFPIVRFSIWHTSIDIIFIFLLAIALLIMNFIGLFVVAIALNFTHKVGEKNEYGWQMERLPKWAWLWSNDYDGVQGQKNGKNYTNSPLDSFWGKYNWTALRNPVNNWSRYSIGIDYNNVELIKLAGTPDVDDDVIGYCHYRIKRQGDWFYFPAFIYNNGKRAFRLGYKAKTYRYVDRPFCGFTVQMFKV